MGSASRFDRPRLETARLVLRRPEPDDGPAIQKAVGHFEVVRGLSRVPYPYRASDAAFFLEEIATTEWVWAITCKESGALLGMIGLTPLADAEAAELGYWLGRVHWGRGHATEAAERVLRYGFEQLDLRFVLAGPFEHNTGSVRVLEKLGFTTTGHAVRPCMALGRDMRSVEMRLERS